MFPFIKDKEQRKERKYGELFFKLLIKGLYMEQKCCFVYSSVKYYENK